MTTRDPHADYYRARSERVTPENAVNWRASVAGILSARDQADLKRLSNRLPAHMLIRYLAAEYMTQDHDSAWSELCRQYGETVEQVTQDYMRQEAALLSAPKETS